ISAYIQDSTCYWQLLSEINVKEFQIINILTQEVIATITADGSLHYQFSLPNETLVKLQINYINNYSQSITIDTKLSYLLSPEWNLIAIHGSTNSDIPLPIWTWNKNNSLYEITHNPPTNIGFWTFSDSYCSIQISLLPNKNIPPLQLGWNLISIDFDVQSSQGELFSWDPQLQIYQPVEHMLPNLGYWFFLHP
ncbi:MAG: hypothetical protein ACRC37_03250, partial [Lentisphaeria bacterium]